MESESRSYNPGSIYRPKPLVIVRPESSLFLVLTSWTSQAEAERAGQHIVEQIEQDQNTDFTRLGDSTQAFFDGTSKLRQAIQTTGQAIYKQSNQKQARLLIEALVIRIQGNSLIWAQAGQPNLYLIRKNRLAPLVVQPDHSILDPGLPPLPSLGLGLEAHTPIQSGVTRYEPGDRLLCLAQSWEPSWPSWSETPSFAAITSHLIEENPDLAYWCSLLSL